MEPIGKLLNQPSSLVPRSPDGITTAPNVSAHLEPQWVDKLELMAISKRQDWAPGILRYWAEKLSEYTDAEICWALNMYSGQYFPDPDVIAGDIKRKRAQESAEATERRTDAYWVEFERNNREIERFKAEHGGKTPQQVWCEENRVTLAKIGEGVHEPTAKATQPGSGVTRKETAAVDESMAFRGDVRPGQSTDEQTGVSGDGQ